MAKRNGLSDSHVAGKRKHTFTKADLEKQIRYMDKCACQLTSYKRGRRINVDAPSQHGFYRRQVPHWFRLQHRNVERH